MCVAIYNPPKVLIDKDAFEKCARTNSDGMGMVIAREGKLEIHKELKDVDAFWNLYAKLREENPTKNIVIHFRMSTQGSISIDNCHPFLVHDDLAFVHNGVVSGMGFDGSKSDTRIYNEKILQKLPKDFHKNKTILKLLVEYGGGFNKFIYIDSDGFVMIVGENNGDYDKEGNWFSNTYWKRDTYYSGYYKTTYGETEYDKNKREGERKKLDDGDKWKHSEDWELQDNGVWKYTPKKNEQKEKDKNWKLPYFDHRNYYYD